MSKLDALVEEIAGSIKDAKGFTKEQLPVISDEILRVGRIKAQIGIWFLGAALAGTVATVAGLLLSKPQGLDSIVILALGTIVVFVWVAGIVATASTLVEIKAAPKLYVLQELREILKGGRQSS